MFERIILADGVREIYQMRGQWEKQGNQLKFCCSNPDEKKNMKEIILNIFRSRGKKLNY